MKVVEGNLWDFCKPPWNALVVIPTNIGWRGDGENVMGRGLAKQAKLGLCGVTRWYGWVCRMFREDTPVVRYFRSAALMFPTKPLASDPARSWNQKSDLELIARSARQLGRWHETTPWQQEIAVPMVGCGNGGLKEAAVWPILLKYLTDDRFVIVRKNA
jgi:hypothetical protein